MRLAIIGITVGGVGLDLTAAQNVVFLELPKSASEMLQVYVLSFIAFEMKSDILHFNLIHLVLVDYFSFCELIAKFSLGVLTSLGIFLFMLPYCTICFTYPRHFLVCNYIFIPKIKCYRLIQFVFAYIKISHYGGHSIHSSHISSW